MQCSIWLYREHLHQFDVVKINPSPAPPPPPKKKLLWLGLPDEISPSDISLVTPQEYFVYKLVY